MARRIIPVSFKQWEDKLYCEVFKHSDHSAFIKSCIEYWINNNTQNNNCMQNKGSTNNVEPIGISNDILNF